MRKADAQWAPASNQAPNLLLRIERRLQQRIVLLMLVRHRFHGRLVGLGSRGIEITTEEEPIGDFIVPAYRRVSTTIYIPPPSGLSGTGQIIEIDPAQLVAPVLKA